MFKYNNEEKAVIKTTIKCVAMYALTTVAIHVACNKILNEK